MTSEKVSALLSILVAISILVASFFQWWRITYNGSMKTKIWIKVLFILLITLLVISLLLLDPLEPLSKFVSWLVGSVSNLSYGSIPEIVTATVALLALFLTRQSGLFDKTPNVLASGTFVISTKVESNQQRDKEIIKINSIHTLQLVNVGRGLARNVTPSKGKNSRGEFLEDVCPNSFALPPGKSTKDLGETLRVHGQLFREATATSFYIDFENYSGKPYKTEVKIKKVGQADGEIEELRRKPGIEIWKVISNNPVHG